jgi:methylmalonyl-CoA/ethylmalonyl-CoA epimerase
MIKELDHIGIAVKSLENIVKTLHDGFGLQPSFEEEVSDQQVRIAGYKIGNSLIEYFEPLSQDSPISQFLEKRGNGVHHLAFSVKNLEESLDSLKKKGFRLIDEKPRIGALGKKIAFLHPSSFDGILIELCEY